MKIHPNLIHRLYNDILVIYANELLKLCKNENVSIIKYNAALFDLIELLEM